MKRFRWVITLLVAVLLPVGLIPSVSAAGVVSGTVTHTVEFGWDGGPGNWVGNVDGPLAGATVTAYSSPIEGVFLDQVVTGSDGTFTLTIPTDDPVCVYVEGPSADWQAGWVWGGDYRGVYPQAPPACYVQPGTALGDVYLMSALAEGQVVDMDGNPIARATVVYVPWDHSGKRLTGVTNADGWYRIPGLAYEEFSVQVSAKGYVGGFLGLDNDDDRGGTWKGILLKAHIDAANWGPGEIGTIGHQIWMNAR